MIRFTRAGVALTVGIILVTGLIVAGLFWVKEQGEQARRDEAIKIAEQNLIDDSANDGVALNDGDEAAAPEDTTDESTNGGSTGSESTDGTTDESASDSSSDEVTANELPATGSEGIGAAIAVAALAFSTAAYVQSRRQLQ